MSKNDIPAEKSVEKTWNETEKSVLTTPAQKPVSDGVEVAVPKSVRERTSTQLVNDIQSLELTAIEIRERTSGAKNTPASDSLKRNKMALQNKINDAAKRFVSVYRPPMNTEIAQHNNELVMIQAMQTHHPCPVVGSFSFGDVYTSYMKGMKYMVPRYVALSLEESDNAVILS